MKTNGGERVELITESEFRKQLKGTFGKGYLFFGDEDYLKAYSLKSARECFCPDPSLSAFNHIKLDALDMTPDSLLDAIVSLPMMSEGKLIEVEGFNPKSFRGSSMLDEYCKVFAMLEEYEYNTLIINVPSGFLEEGQLPKRPSPTLKKLGEHLTLVRFAKSTPLMLARWLAKHFLANGIKADSAVCAALVEYCGTDMHRLATETDKLSWYSLSKGLDEVDPKDIAKVSIADTSYDTFALTNAIVDGNKQMALSVLGEMQKRRIEPVVVMGEITSTVCDMLRVRAATDDGLSQDEIYSRYRIHQFRTKMFLRSGASYERLRSVMALCMEVDSAIKSSTMSGYTAIERLICVI